MLVFKLGVCEWGFPMPEPYAVKTAEEYGFSGLELDFGAYEKAYPLSVPAVQRAYLEMADDYGIEFPSMTIDSLNWYGLTQPLDSRNGMIAFDGIRRGITIVSENTLSARRWTIWPGWWQGASP